MKKSPWIVLACLFLTSSSHAQDKSGNGAGNGGGALICPTLEFDNPVTQQPQTGINMMLDFYEGTLPTVGGKTVDLSVLKGLGRDAVAEKLFQAAGSIFPSFETDLRASSAQIGTMDEWLAADLSPHNDTGAAYEIPAGCTYEQAAWRQDDFVYADLKVLAKLDETQRGFLAFHEPLYHLGDAHQLETSDPVRKVVRILLESISDPQASLSAAQMNKLKKNVHSITKKTYLEKSYREAVRALVVKVETGRVNDEEARVGFQKYLTVEGVRALGANLAPSDRNFLCEARRTVSLQLDVIQTYCPL